jgi:O-antigen/teichoic acid export membrane protein
MKGPPEMPEMAEIADGLKDDITKVVKGTGVSLIGSATGRGLLFVTQIAIVRLFGSEVFGLYVLGLALVKMVETVSRFGLDAGSMKFVSVYHRTDPGSAKGTLLSALSISFLSGVAASALLYLSADSIADAMFHQAELRSVIRTFAFSIPFVSSSQVAANATLGFHTTKYAVAIREIFQPAANLLLVFLFSSTRFELVGVVYAFALSYLFTFLLSLYLLGRIYRRRAATSAPAVFHVGRLVRYSVPLIFVSLLYYLLSWTDILMLGHFVDAPDVSIYRAASLVPFVLSLVLTASNSIYAPIVADLHHRGERERMGRILKTTTRWVFSITLPLLIIILFSSRAILNAFFGSEFAQKGGLILIILAGAHFINCATGGVALTLQMTGRQKVALFNSAMLVASNIVLNYLLIPRYGGIGAALATASSISMINAVAVLEVYFLYRIHPYDRGYSTGLVSAGMAVAILLWIVQATTLSPAGSFFGTTAVTLTVFLSIFFLYHLFFDWSPEDRFVLTILKNTVSNLRRRSR